MSNPFHHFWLFVYAVGDHTFTLAAGCVLTVVINLIEKYAMDGKRLPLKADIAILLSFVFFACFQAWRDEYDKVTTIPTVPVIQVTVPPITVPPAQVIVTPPSQVVPPPSNELTGFIEIAHVGMVTPTLMKGSPISVNVGFINKGPQIINDAYTSNAAILVDYDKSPDSQLEKTSEEEVGKQFGKAVENLKKQITQQKLRGKQLGVGNGMLWQTVVSPPVSERQVGGIISGLTRLYVTSWATWKDSGNRKGKLLACVWMQNPPSLDLSKPVWHLCQWMP